MEGSGYGGYEMNLIATNIGPCFKLVLKDGTYFDVTPDLIDMYKMAYPRINVEEELGKMVAWHLSNESKRKTRRGIKRSINSWLNAAKPQQVQAGISQREYAQQTTISDRVNNLDWAADL